MLKFENHKLPPLSTDQLAKAYDVVGNVVEILPEQGIDELFEGSSNDIDTLIDVLVNEACQVLYGGTLYETNLHKLNYVEKLGESFEETLRYASFNYFRLAVFSDFEMNWHHLEWGNLVQLYKLLCIIAARDHSKSHTFSLEYPIWRAYQYLKRPSVGNNINSPLFIQRAHSKEGLLITNEYSLAKKLLKKIREQIETNDLLRDKLKPERRDGWGKEELTTKNGCNIALKSYGSTMRGPHPGWIVVDDFLSKQALYSKDQRDKFTEVFDAEIMNMIIPGGQVLVVGTPFHEKDLYAELRKRKKWRSFTYPAVFPDGKLLWNDRYNLQQLLDKREDQGSIIFSREILCKPVSSASTIFPYDTVKLAFLKMHSYKLSHNIQSFNRKFVRVVMGCDFAISASVGADYSVFTVLGVDELDNFWLIDLYRAKGKSYSEQMGQIRSMNARFRPEVIMMESNQMQSIFVEGAEESGLPVVPHNTGVNKYDLTKGLPGMAVLFEKNKIKFPRGDQRSINITDIIVSELTSVSWTNKGKLEGVGDHDDTVMSLWLALMAAKYVNSNFEFSFV